MPVWVVVVIVLAVAGGFFACFSYLKGRSNNEEEERKLDPPTAQEKAERLRRTEIVHNRRMSFSKTIVSLDIIFLTFTPVLLLTGLDKLQGVSARTTLFRLGVLGLAFALASLGLTLLYWLFTVIGESRGLGVSNYWLLAKACYWYEVGLFLTAVLLVVVGVFVLLASV